MNSFYMIISIIATIFITSVFYFIRVDRYKDLSNQLVFCILSGVTASFFEVILSRFISSLIYTIIESQGGEQLFFVVSLIAYNIIEIVIIYGLLLMFLNKDIGSKEKYDGIIFSVFITAGFLLAKFIFPGILYGFPQGTYSALLAIPLTFSSSIILGYFIGLEKREEKQNLELHFIGLGGAVFVMIFYYTINRFINTTMMMKIIYLGFLIVTSIYLTKTHLDEIGRVRD